MNWREVADILTANGFVEVRTGKHKVFHGTVGGLSRTVPIPVHSKDIPVGTLAGMIRQSGLDRSLFEK